MDRERKRSIAVVASVAGSLLNFRGQLLEALVKQGYSVITFAPAAPEIALKLRAIGVEFRSIPLERTGMGPLSDIFLLAHLYREFSALRPDVVFSYTIKPVLYATIAARLARVPVIIAMMTGLGYVFTGDSLRRRCLRSVVTLLYRIALRKAQCVFFQNHDDHKVFLEKRILAPGMRVEHINGSGVDVDRFSPTMLPHTVSFLMIARVIRDKGVFEYVAAARLLHSRYPGILCRLAGPLDSNPSAVNSVQLRAWVDEGAVQYLGELEDVRPAITDTAVYVLPSYREGMPRTVLEAMSMGRPVITTDVPGCRDTVIDGESGRLVPDRDANALCAAMIKYLEDPASVARMGAAARERAIRVFDVRRVNETIVGVIQELLADHPISRTSSH